MARGQQNQQDQQGLSGQHQGRRIVLWRHGQTKWNFQQRFQGRTDIELDDAGLQQAQRSARMLAALSPETVVASDLRRASDTAQELTRIVGAPVTLDSRLQERSMGSWEGLTHAEVVARFPAEWAIRQPAGGETYEQVGDRVAAAARDALEKVVDGGTLVLVSHGAAIRSGIARLLDLPVEVWPRLGGLANCCWSVLEQGRGGWRLVEHNAGSLPDPVLSDDR